jgi:phosphatidylserine decarboxylase
VRRQGGWLPDNQDELEAWLAGHRERVAAKGEQVPLQPVLAEFQALIDSDPVVRMYLSEMVAQVPRNRQYRKRRVESVPQLLQLINEVLTMAPEYNEDAMVVLPLAAILDWTMGTPAGFAAFRDRRINAMLKKILGVWCEFLSSSDSRYVLNDSPSGWKGRAARRAIGIEQYQYDPGDEYWGFTSWNDFFTRCLCESTPYGLAVDVQRQDQFWLKSQPYSLQDMLANDESADRFVGGTVYQAFLSATNYHRWTVR